MVSSGRTAERNHRGAGTTTPSVCLDGVVQGPGGREEDTHGGFQNGGWSMPFFDVEAMGGFIGETMETTEALLYGRRTWQTMAAVWPDRAGDPFADRMNEIKKYVASRTLGEGDLTWSNTTRLPSDDAIGAVRRLRAEVGGDIQVMGARRSSPSSSRTTWSTSTASWSSPSSWAAGSASSPPTAGARTLELVDCKVAGTGVLMCMYRPAAG